MRLSFDYYQPWGGLFPNRHVQVDTWRPRIHQEDSKKHAGAEQAQFNFVAGIKSPALESTRRRVNSVSPSVPPSPRSWFD